MLWGFHEGFDYDDTMKYMLMTSLEYDWNVKIIIGKIWMLTSLKGACGIPFKSKCLIVDKE